MTTAPRKVAQGCRGPDSTRRQVVVRLDDETFDQVQARAVKEGTSFGEQVRLLVEWGLETAREART